MAEWLTLAQYSIKYKVSISTLRRRIKSRELEYVFEKGRYLIKKPDDSVDLNQQQSFKELQNLYMKILEEKEKKIQDLEVQIQDLQTLVNILETEKKDVEISL